jgi:hypothetical protein
MAKTIVGFTDTTSDAWVAQMVAALAALTNPTIRGLGTSIANQQRRIGTEYRAVLTYDTGGAALATPFLVRNDQAGTLAALITAVQAFYAANPTYFICAPIFYTIDNPVNTPLYGALTLYNVTAGASANFLPLNP